MNGSRVHSRPSVTVSYAQTLDGRIATVTGSSQWISGEESLEFAHRLRAEHGAVMVGAGTVCTDNPRLTVRLVKGENPLRVVVDGALRMPLSSSVLADGAAKGTLVAVTGRAPERACERVSSMGAAVVRLPEAEEGVDLGALLDELGKRGVDSVLVEGGARLVTSLLRHRLVDRMAVCVAPAILGNGISAVGELGIRRLGACLRLSGLRVEPYGEDLVFDGRVEYPR